MKNTAEVLVRASEVVLGLRGRVLDVLSVAKPASTEAGVAMCGIVSKLSPIIGNLLEMRVVELLNADEGFPSGGRWLRQDPGFPDAVFEGPIAPQPGIEIKVWFPLATEITARFRDSQRHLAAGNTHLALLAWLPSGLVYGSPKVLDVCVVPALSVAQARDKHYHHPPDYLVREPEDTSSRTRNLQQTNTNGYKWQGGDEKKFADASRLVKSWGSGATTHSTSEAYQAKLQALMGRFTYRLDTNFAKIDRIEHPAIEAFKTKVQASKIGGRTVSQWSVILASGENAVIEEALKPVLG